MLEQVIDGIGNRIKIRFGAALRLLAIRYASCCKNKTVTPKTENSVGKTQ
jgi:hypothetical protein